MSNTNNTSTAMSNCKMREKFRAFRKACYELSEAWDNDIVENYPEYLPSFDEFVNDIDEMVKLPEFE